ncbi:MAG: ASKHA domain-containing protein, partial [Candidatus Ranarchaeia archaeon]
IESICGGKGSCGKCRVLVLNQSSQVSPLSEGERRLLSKEDIASGIRLACLTKVKDNVRVQIASESRVKGQRILEKGIKQDLSPDPWCKRLEVTLPPASLAKPVSVHQRAIDFLGSRQILSPKISLEHVNYLAENEKQSNGRFTFTVDAAEKVWRIVKGDATRESYGVAIDIGTTTIVGYLVDLLKGETHAVASGLNPQVIFGEDVMSRITAALGGKENRDKLTDTLHRFLADLIRTLCGKAGIQADSLDEIVVVGNTSMHHFFLGLDQRSLGLSPYVPAIQEMTVTPADHFNLGVKGATAVTVLPVLAGFVGADAIAVMVATRLDEAEKPALAVDIGTNGEIMLGGSQGLIACSTAAGPAFEGAHIQSGLRGAKGAIERVEISNDQEHVSYTVIGDGKPRGICGSGIVDVVAEMLKTKIITPKGNFSKDSESPLIRVNPSNHRKEFVLVPGKDTATGSDIVFTQKDVRELQLAKGAIYAGQEILLRENGLSPADLDCVYLAGAFGNYIRVESAVRIGLLPDLSLSRIVGVGNAAGSGAKAVLISRNERERANKIAKSCRYVELTIAKNFQQHFLDATYLPHKNLAAFPRVARALGLDTAMVE